MAMTPKEKEIEIIAWVCVAIIIFSIIKIILL